MRQGVTEKPAGGGRKNWVDRLLQWCMALLVALVLVLILTQGIFVNAYIPSSSMEDTIMTGDRVIGLRMSYWVQAPQRFDIIIFRYPDDERQLYVKRVVGLPGEELQVRDGLVYINGGTTPLDYSFVKGSLVGNFGPVQVPEGCYFVMGDNRNESWDSRYWENTFVKKSQVVARAAWCIWPEPCALG